LKKFGVSSSENSKQDEKEEADQLFASAFRLDKVDLPSLLNSGRESLQVNFSYLDSALSVSQPLVDFFVEHDFLLLTEQYTVSIVERLNNEGSNAAGSEAQQQESSFSQRTITDAYDCLTKIFWTAEEREEEMQAIIRNAFGPLGTLMRVRQELSKPLSSSKLKNF
jgi:hypothetical protein